LGFGVIARNRAQGGGHPRQAQYLKPAIRLINARERTGATGLFGLINYEIMVNGTHGTVLL